MEESYNMENIKNFLKEVAHPIWHKDGTLKRNRPIQYSITKIIDPKKRSTKYVVGFNNINLNNQPTKEIAFSVTKKTFKSDEYDFSSMWQQFQTQLETATAAKI